MRVDRTKRSESGPIPVDFYVAINESYYENSTRKVGADMVSDTSKLQQDIAFEVSPNVSKYYFSFNILAALCKYAHGIYTLKT